MSYNAKNAKEVESESLLPKNDILKGIIKNIEDKTVKDFIPEKAHSTWQGELSQPAINITVEVLYNDKPVNIERLFTYSVAAEADPEKGITAGETVFNKKSNLAKYNRKYGKLPEVGDQVQISTDKDGFGKVVID